MNLPAIFVELIGTFLFLYIIISTGNPLVIGSTLAFLIYIGLDYSGAHFNPAVTMMMLYNNGIAFDNASGYIIAQIIGALMAVTFHNKIKQHARL